MRRKVIQLAEKTLVVSLPAKWVQEWNIKKGDELEFLENGHKITISTENEKAPYKCSVNIENTTERALRWLLSSLHKKGYDEIEIHTADQNQEGVIDELLKDLFIGFTLVYRSPTRCVIRAISKDSAEEFETVLRRAFLITLNMGEELIYALKNNKYNQLDKILALEKTNNQLTNFCERSLNKRGDPLKTTFLYVIVWNLEKIADDYKYICEEIKKGGQELNKELIEILNEVNELFRQYYELFYKFELQKLNKLSEKFKELKSKIKTELTKTKHQIILSHTLHLLLKTADFSSSIYALNT